MNDEQFETDQTIKDAFDRLSNDASKVNAMVALRAHEDQKRGAGWLNGPGGLVYGLAFAVLLLVGGLILFNRGETLVESEAPIAARVVDDDSGVEIPEDELEAAIAEAETADVLTTTIPAEETGGGTSSSFEDLLACSLSTPGGSIGETTATELVDILTFDNGSCRRTVFQFEDGAAINPDDIVSVAGPAGGIDILYDFDLATEFAELPENRDAGFSGQGIRLDGTPYFYVNHGQAAALSSVTILNNPARIIVDTPSVDAASEPLFGTNVILPAAIGEVEVPFTVRGHARPFEAFGEVQLRRAPESGQPAGSGDIVNADWSGNESLGDLTASTYGFNANFAAWGDFAFTIDRLGPGDYEFVFVNSAAGEETPDFIALVAPFSVDATPENRGNDLAPVSIDELPANFPAVIDELRTRTSVPIVMPTEFPNVADPDSELFLTILSADENSYEVVIGFVPDCNGASACRYGSVVGIPEEDGVTDFSGERALLRNQISGQFFESTCGAGCSDAIVLWQDGEHEFSIGLKGALMDDAFDFAATVGPVTG